MERDTGFYQFLVIVEYFNSHAHVERDNFTYIIQILRKNFNSHAHVERDMFGVDISVKISDFNSHAHVERDVLKIVIDALQNISTHTLTWSVTGICNFCKILYKFQLTRSRGA